MGEWLSTTGRRLDEEQRDQGYAAVLPAETNVEAHPRRQVRVWPKSSQTKDAEGAGGTP